MKEAKVNLKFILVVMLILLGLIYVVSGIGLTVNTPTANEQISAADSPYLVNVSIVQGAENMNITNVTAYYQTDGGPLTLACFNDTVNLTEYTCSWTVPELNGTYILNVSIYNQSLATQINSTAVSILVDTIFPTVSSFSPGANSNTTTNDLTVSFTAQDAYNLSACDLFLYFNDAGGVNQTNSSLFTTSATTITKSFTSLADGAYKVRGECNDSHGNRNNSQGNVTVTIDTIAPAYDTSYFATANVSDYTPNAGDLFWMIVNWTDATLNVQTAILYFGSNGAVNTTTTVTDSTALNLTYVIPQGNNGTYNVYMWANDSLNNENQTINITVTVTEQTPPAPINLNSPVNGANSSSGSVAFNFTAYDNLDTGLTCNLTIDAVVNISNIITANGTPQINTTTGFADGSHSWNVSCWDTAGNFNETPIGRSFNVDTIAPAFDINITSAISVSAGSGVWIYANWTDATTGAKNATLNLNGTVVISNSSLDSGTTSINYTYTTTSSQTGSTLNFTITVEDYTGNYNTTKIMQVSVTDSQPPKVVQTSPANGANESSGTVSVSFNISDNSADSVTCNITIGGVVNLTNQAYTGISPIFSTKSATINGTLNDGSHSWNVTCWEGTNVNDTAVTKSFNVDTVAPAFDLNSTSPTTVNSGATVYVYANWTDATTGIKNASLLVGGSINVTNQTVGGATSINFSYVAQDADIGALSLAIRVWDYAGNVNTTSTMSVTVTDGTPPNVVLASPVEGYNISSTSASLQFNVTDNNAGTTVNCNVTVDGVVNTTAASSTITAGTYQTLTATITGLADGTHNWNVTCWDSSSAVNDTGVTRSFIIDTTQPTTAPRVTSVSDSDDDGNLEIAWSADTSAKYYNLYRASSSFTTASGTPLLENTTSTSFEDNTTTHGTIYYYALTSIDHAGNENTSVINTTSGVSSNATANDTIKAKIPTAISVSNASNTATIGWPQVLNDISNNADFTGLTYQVYYGTSINMSKALVNETLTSTITAVTYPTNSTTLSVPSSCGSSCRYYFVVTTTDDGSNKNLSLGTANMANITLSYTASTTTTDDSTSTSSRTSSPGVVSGFATNPRTVGMWTTISAGSAAELSIVNQEIPFKKLTIRVKNDVETVRVNVEKLNTKPGIILGAPGITYDYLKITEQNMDDADISSIVFRFMVEKAWLSEKGIDEADIVLYRFTNEEWVKLPTDEESSSDEYVYYDAVSPGLSYFAISTSEEGVAEAEVAEEETPAEGVVPAEVIEGEDIPPTEKASLFKSKKVLIGLAAAVIAIIVISVMSARKRRHRAYL